MPLGFLDTVVASLAKRHSRAGGNLKARSVNLTGIERFFIKK